MSAHIENILILVGSESLFVNFMSMFVRKAGNRVHS